MCEKIFLPPARKIFLPKPAEEAQTIDKPVKELPASR
jgi:hypothetical protein